MNRTKAIKMKCKECVYDPHAEGTWLDQVANCTSSTCALYEVRPMPLSHRKQPDLHVKQAENRA